MEGLAMPLILGGVILVGVGLLFLVSAKIPFFGQLPGDILIKREKFTFFFPVATCITLSIVLTIILNLFLKH